MTWQQQEAAYRQRTGDQTGVNTDAIYPELRYFVTDYDRAAWMIHHHAETWGRRARRASGFPVYRDARLEPHTPKRAATT
jgi:hypothetical protein